MGTSSSGGSDGNFSGGNSSGGNESGPGLNKPPPGSVYVSPNVYYKDGFKYNIQDGSRTMTSWRPPKEAPAPKPVAKPAAKRSSKPAAKPAAPVAKDEPTPVDAPITPGERAEVSAPAAGLESTIKTQTRTTAGVSVTKPSSYLTKKKKKVGSYLTS